jgi:2,3-bisphosphoglycerate-independent phosphoglycerate mutase
MNKKAMLIIMDGWGKGKEGKQNAIMNAHTPFMDQLDSSKDVAKAELDACGEEVGLPDGQMGNSEVGHMNIGSGRVVYQDLVRINKAVQDNSMAQNETLLQAYDYAKANNKQIHFLGLVSDGGVHSSTEHLKKLVEIATNLGLKDSYIHILTDGRDTDPRSGLGYVKDLENFLENQSSKIASVCGRYYTMDRDKRWERIKKGYDLMTAGDGKTFSSAVEAIQNSYEREITDEFIEPSVIVDEHGKALTSVQEGDVFICFNFRTDRLREITTVLTQQDMPEHGMKTMPLHYLTMTIYDESFKGIRVIFDKQSIHNTMGEHLSSMGLHQLRIAETEKYPHVTFFFNGGREEPFKNEDRVMVNSPKVATYDLQPEMSAPEVTEKVLDALETEKYEFICLNYANSDMVGHTGVYDAILKAVETVDQSVEQVITKARELGYSVFLTADHGNSDNAVNPDGSPNTAHSLNKVPAYLLDDDFKQLKNGRLADIAPTLLHIMGLNTPKEMTGRTLV